jgi:hypothetical protein
MSAQAGAHENMAPEAIRTAALMIRITYSVSLSITLERIGGHEKHTPP